MKKLYFLFNVLLINSLSFGQTNVGISGTVDGVYINEIHYDNDGADVGEFIEVAGPAGTDLSSYTITLYNGSATQLKLYKTISLTGSIDNESMSGVRAVVVPLVGNIQNGAPDGLSLSKTGSTDVQFLSYEGTFTPSDGPAMNLLSVDIGVEESPPFPTVGHSLEYNESTLTWVIVSDDSPGGYAQGPTLSSVHKQIDGFGMYPNPTSLGYVNISSRSNSKIEVIVYNILGKQVVNKIVANKILDVSELNAGIYIMKVTQDEASITKKLVIK